MKNKAKMFDFSFFFKKRFGYDFHSVVPGLYTHDLRKNEKKHLLISLLSETLCETANFCFIPVHTVWIKPYIILFQDYQWHYLE